MSKGENDKGRLVAPGSAFEDQNAREASTVPEHTFDRSELEPLIDAGFWIVRLHPGGKIPDQPWKHSTALTAAKIDRYARERHNFGVKLRLREPGVYELIVDCDPRNYARDELDECRARSQRRAYGRFPQYRGFRPARAEHPRADHLL